jgi:5'(3')-deoxyribonucleotidase
VKKSKKKDYTILVDIDNVLNNFTETVLDLYNKEHGTFHKMTDIYKYSMEETLNIPFNILYDYFVNEEVLDNCKPLKDAPKYLNILNNISKLYIVTARDWLQLLNIDKWFERNYPFIDNRQIIRCRDKHLVQGDIRIDDHYDNLRYAKGEKILFNYPFNSYIDLSNEMVYRVNNWKECFIACMSLMNYSTSQIEEIINGGIFNGQGSNINWNIRT